MAEALNLQVVVKLIGSLTNVLDLSAPSDPLSRDYSLVFADGTGANQANMMWHDQRTLTASAAETLDLVGSLTSVFGTTISLTAIKGILVAASSGNTNNVLVSRPSSEGVTVFSAASDAIAVRPGGIFLWVDPSAAGITTTAATSDDLTLTNSAGSTSVVYDIVIWGEV